MLMELERVLIQNPKLFYYEHQVSSANGQVELDTVQAYLKSFPTKGVSVPNLVSCLLEAP